MEKNPSLYSLFEHDFSASMTSQSSSSLFESVLDNEPFLFKTNNNNNNNNTPSKCDSTSSGSDKEPELPLQSPSSPSPVVNSKKNSRKTKRKRDLVDPEEKKERERAKKAAWRAKKRDELLELQREVAVLREEREELAGENTKLRLRLNPMQDPHSSQHDPMLLFAQYKLEIEIAKSKMDQGLPEKELRPHVTKIADLLADLALAVVFNNDNNVFDTESGDDTMSKIAFPVGMEPSAEAFAKDDQSRWCLFVKSLAFSERQVLAVLSLRSRSIQELEGIFAHRKELTERFQVIAGENSLFASLLYSNSLHAEHCHNVSNLSKVASSVRKTIADEARVRLGVVREMTKLLDARQGIMIFDFTAPKIPNFLGLANLVCAHRGILQ